jgi:hypothetical protein
VLIISNDTRLPQTKPLSPCRAQVLKDAEKYMEQHVHDSEWMPIIEAEIRACIEKGQ